MWRIHSVCWWLSALLLLPLLIGCASSPVVPNYVARDQAVKMRSLAIVASCSNESLQVLDIAGVRREMGRSQPGAVLPFGVLGAAVGALTVEGISAYKIRSLVPGGTEPIKKGLEGFDVKSTFDEIVGERFSDNVKTKTHIAKVTMLKPSDVIQGSGSDSRISLRDKQDSPDTLLFIRYVYGIGGLTKEKLASALVADIRFIRVPEGETLMADTMVAYCCDENSYTVADYARDNGKIYRECFRQTVEKLAFTIADRAFLWDRLDSEP